MNHALLCPQWLNRTLEEVWPFYDRGLSKMIKVSRWKSYLNQALSTSYRRVKLDTLFALPVADTAVGWRSPSHSLIDCLHIPATNLLRPSFLTRHPCVFIPAHRKLNIFCSADCSVASLSRAPYFQPFFLTPHPCVSIPAHRKWWRRLLSRP